ncbi:hypothetical protein [Acinetobacter sp. 99]|uniref:hypothetical protein n=1 Tax=Acinetobacter sp. 99 TaxID=3098765 RepID=UPI00300BC05C
MIVAKALLSTADQLGLKQAQIASVIKVHRISISRLKVNPVLVTLHLSKVGWSYSNPCLSHSICAKWWEFRVDSSLH